MAVPIDDKSMYPRVAVVTAIFSPMDYLHEPSVQSIGTDFYCFCNAAPANTGKTKWRIILQRYHPKIPEFKRNNKLVAKWYKMQAHKIPLLNNYQYILWIDGSVLIKNSNFVRRFVRSTASSICVFPHPWRDCIYEEYEQVKAKQECTANDGLTRQIHKYDGQKYPIHNGLYCGTIIGRWRGPQIDKTMDDWWDEVLNYSMRDQISLPYVLWRNRIKPSIFKRNIYHNDYIDKCPHTAYYYYCYRKNKTEKIKRTQ